MGLFKVKLEGASSGGSIGFSGNDSGCLCCVGERNHPNIRFLHRTAQGGAGNLRKASRARSPSGF
jgi:hypothetical protein